VSEYDDTGALRHWSPTTLSLAVAIWMSLVLNVPFWRSAWAATVGGDSARVGFLLSLPVVVTLWIALALEVLAWGRARKPVLAALLLIAAPASYFMLTYGVLLDRTMVANVLQTHAAETLELITWRSLLWTLLLGLVPAVLLFLVPVTRVTWQRELWRKTAVLGTLSAALVGIVLAFFSSYASLARNHRDLRLQLVPTNVLAATYSYAKRRLAAPAVLQAMGVDAVSRQHPAGARPRVLVLVVGETARAANFSLLGYARNTNPRLGAEADLLAFRNASSCGTATAVSLPCMFLDVGREHFDMEMASTRESLLDVVQRAGVKVLWRDNNSGCKGICDRVPHEDVARDPVAGLCAAGECWDEVLLSGLARRLERVTSDTVIVLHMKGSHGPAYYRRYPPEFERFKPACRSTQLDQCSRESIVNAYDNSILYTDHVLARTIELLRSHAKEVALSMMFVSDHGESLGERGLYLHGMPYALAPDEQKRIPFLLWLPTDRTRDWSLDAACLRSRSSQPVSHDDIYAMVLGLMGVRTAMYDRKRDVLANCRSE
jgi:lipid A ethanolaminephosphotransferase